MFPHRDGGSGQVRHLTFHFDHVRGGSIADVYDSKGRPFGKLRLLGLEHSGHGSKFEAELFDIAEDVQITMRDGPRSAFFDARIVELEFGQALHNEFDQLFRDITESEYVLRDAEGNEIARGPVSDLQIKPLPGKTPNWMLDVEGPVFNDKPPHNGGYICEPCGLTDWLNGNGAPEQDEITHMEYDEAEAKIDFQPAFDMPTTAEQAIAKLEAWGSPLCMTFNASHAARCAELLKCALAESKMSAERNGDSEDTNHPASAHEQLREANAESYAEVHMGGEFVAKLLREYDDVVSPSLTFNELRAANIARLPLFKNRHGAPAHSKPDGSDWSPAQWLQAVTGELGEYANLRKKHERGDVSAEEFIREAAKELADVQIYLDLLALQLGIDLGAATVAKFDEVSDRVGCNVKLGPPQHVFAGVQESAGYLHECVRCGALQDVNDDRPCVRNNFITGFILDGLTPEQLALKLHQCGDAQRVYDALGVFIYGYPPLDSEGDPIMPLVVHPGQVASWTFGMGMIETVTGTLDNGMRAFEFCLDDYGGGPAGEPIPLDRPRSKQPRIRIQFADDKAIARAIQDLSRLLTLKQ